ncbi:MAG: photosystem II reaction center protein Psb28 [Cyanobacteria bacterium J06636_16]
MLYGGPEGEDLRSVECKLEIDRDDLWERFIRFIHRYAEANGLTYRDIA